MAGGLTRPCRLTLTAASLPRSTACSGGKHARVGLSQDVHAGEHQEWVSGQPGGGDWKLPLHAFGITLHHALALWGPHMAVRRRLTSAGEGPQF